MRFRLLTGLFLISLSYGIQLKAQYGVPTQLQADERMNRDLIQLKIWYHPDSTLTGYDMQVFLELSNDFLQFTQGDSSFSARYAVTVNISAEDGESAGSQSERRNIDVSNYQDTNLRSAKHLHRFRYHIQPGRYTLFYEIKDYNGGEPYQQKESLQLNPVQQLSLSPPLFFEQTEDPGRIAEQEPLLIPSRGANSPPIEARVVLATKDTDNPVYLKYAFLSQGQDSTVQKTIRINNVQPRQWLRLPVPENLNFGQHLLQIEVNQGGQVLTSKEKFVIRWQSHSHFLPELTSAAEVLTYIMEKDRYKAMMAAPAEEQQKILEKFWKDHDPTPGTEQNELEEEYYRRVQFVNQYYSAWKKKQDGWKTDRGRTYIMYGPPTQIEKPLSTTDVRRAYEIWHYRELNRKFLFVDRFGTGEYILYSEE